MRRLVHPFSLTLGAIVAAVYAYLSWRLAATALERGLLAVPFALVWVVPVVYWVGERESDTRADELLHGASYVAMAWLNFAVLLCLVRDAALGLSSLMAPAASDLVHAHAGPGWVVGGAFVLLAAGTLLAFRGPHVRHVTIAIDDLHPGLEGFTIAQISDLHVGPTIGRRYVSRVVALSNALAPDLVALTGDFVDGPVRRLAPHVAPLEGLAATFGSVFVLGNHDCYSGAREWVERFRSLGIRVLLNEHMEIACSGATLLVGGVVDPALRLTEPAERPRPDIAAAPHRSAALRILLAHNPALAPAGAKAGFDLQLSGHTHAGQFFPWTIAARWVHGPRVAGLSREGRMCVYVNSGTGTWGPPVRFGSEPELTLIRLVRPQAAPLSPA